ncbi:MAG: dolichyl-phosphate beta-glucosyltransferase [Patescibacteria group bacterium]|jgi:dolichyl-phosphate beta-glucosyltransferase
MTESIYLSVIVPAYNESKRIAKTVKEIDDYLKSQKYSYEIVVVDDGSKDNTFDVVSGLKLPHVRPIKQAKNTGKGGAVKTGMLSAVGEYRLMCDADNATPISEITKLLAFANEFPVVIGSRYMKGSNIRIKQPLTRIIGSRLFNTLVQLLLLPGFPDTQCGFKLFRANVVDKLFGKLETNRWGFDLEILVRARKSFLYIKQVPVEWCDQEGSSVNGVSVFISAVKELINIKKQSKKWK